MGPAVLRLASLAIMFTFATTWLIAGCSGQQYLDALDEAEEEATSASALSATKLPPPADPSERVYFDTPAFDFHSEDAALTQRVFSAQAKHEFKLTATALDDSMNLDPSGEVGFKLYRLGRLRGRPEWKLVTTVDGTSGQATIKYTGPHPRTYMVVVTGSPLPMTTRIDLGCAGGRQNCEVAPQPGDACGAVGRLSKCDTGLYCTYPEASCGEGDTEGICAIPPQVCPLFSDPTCGCDGKTYGNACEAGSAGTSVSHSGTCVSK